MDEPTIPPQETAITTPPRRRKIKLNDEQRRELVERRQVELAVSYFLDLEQDRTLKQISEEMGISVSSLKRLTNSPTFQEVYDEQMMQLGHHPRLQALSSSLPELAPLAYKALKRLLGPGIAHTAQVSAVKLLFDTLKISDQVREEDPAALSNFMKSKGVNVEGNLIMNVNLPIPLEYQQAFHKYMGNGEEPINAVATDVEQSPTSETPQLTEG